MNEISGNIVEYRGYEILAFAHDAGYRARIFPPDGKSLIIPKPLSDYYDTLTYPRKAGVIEAAKRIIDFQEPNSFETSKSLAIAPE